MNDAWVEVPELKRRLHEFFGQNAKEFSRFGSTVNQTFEAFVFAQVAAWYRDKPGWAVSMKNPSDQQTGKEIFRLKFSTRGRPENYSYVKCVAPNGDTFQIRHQLRVSTRAYRNGTHPRANICLDVAVIRDEKLEAFKTNDHVLNGSLVTFGEAKHMSAFAELVAGFLGLVYELQPERLKRIRTRTRTLGQEHPPPFLFVSGNLWQTAEGVILTIKRRRFDVDVYHRTNALSSRVTLP